MNEDDFDGFEAEFEADATAFDDDPNPYAGTYSEDGDDFEEDGEEDGEEE